MIKLFRKKLNKWLEVSDLKIGMKIAVPKAEVFSNYHGGKADNNLLEKGEGDIMWDEIVEIKKLKEEPVYDIEVEGTHNFIAGHLIDSKTGKQLSKEEEKEYLSRPASEVIKPKLSKRQREAMLKKGKNSVAEQPWFGGIFAHNTYISGGIGVNRTSPAAGSIDISGSYLTNGADYAEYFYTRDTDLEPGEAVCVDLKNENAVMRCARCGDTNLMGIVSSNPSIVGNGGDNKENNPNYKIIGMLGQVPAKVSIENGVIRSGDSLTSASSTPGVLMKARAGDPTVGIALENFSSPEGEINVLISRRNKSITVEEVEEKVSERIANMEIEDEVNILISTAIDTLNLDEEININLDPKLLLLETELTAQTNELSQKIINTEDSIKTLNSAITKLNSGLSNSQLLLSSLESIFNEAISNLEKAFLIDADGNVRFGSSANFEENPSVAVVEIETASSTIKTAFVVNQEGESNIADFRAKDVSVMNIDNNGKVSIVGEFLVDGRIMACSGGSCGETLDTLVDETMGDMGVEGKVVAGAFEGYCDDGFAWVPGSSKYGTMPGFCVMKAKARHTNNSELDTKGYESSNLVWTDLSQADANLACQELGDNHHLVSEKEWLTIAENALRVSENDINKEKEGLQLATSSPEKIEKEKDGFRLTNSNVIYELASSVGEWTNEISNKEDIVEPLANEWQEYYNITSYKALKEIRPPYYLSSENGIGRILTGENNNVLRGYVRGINGIYSLDLSNSPETISSSIGFRCAK